MRLFGSIFSHCVTPNFYYCFQCISTLFFPMIWLKQCLLENAKKLKRKDWRTTKNVKKKKYLKKRKVKRAKTAETCFQKTKLKNNFFPPFFPLMNTFLKIKRSIFFKNTKRKELLVEIKIPFKKCSKKVKKKLRLFFVLLEFLSPFSVHFPRATPTFWRESLP